MRSLSNTRVAADTKKTAEKNLTPIESNPSRLNCNKMLWRHTSRNCDIKTAVRVKSKRVLVRSRTGELHQSRMSSYRAKPLAADCVLFLSRIRTNRLTRSCDKRSLKCTSLVQRASLAHFVLDFMGVCKKCWLYFSAQTRRPEFRELQRLFKYSW